MATKEEVLQYIQALGAQNIISRDELMHAYDLGGGKKSDLVMTKRLGVAEILYYIGGAIIFLGIVILLAQNWTTLGFVTKVLVTVGAGIAAYVVGVVFSKDVRTETVASAFFLISALVMPMGLWIIFDQVGFDASSHGLQTVIAGILLATYLLSYVVQRKNVFILFSVLFGTWLFFSLTSFLVGSRPSFDDWDFYQYRVLAAGLMYIFLGYSFSKNVRAPLRGFLYGFGILGFLGAALTLGGWEPNQNIFWELIYPGLVFGTLFLSVYLKSKAFLTWGTLFLMAYILKITSEYFSSGLGWPLALVIAGLAMIGVGYMSISLKKKYLST